MPEKKKVTIRDIARRANVSMSTVSRVLNETTPVAADKELAVLAAVADLDYQPNIFARGLAGGQSMTIGVLAQNFGSPFYDTIMRGILSGFEATRYSPLFADGRWQASHEQRALQTLLGRRVDGVIVVGGSVPAAQLVEMRTQLPLVVAAREVVELPDCCIFIDNVAAARAATRHLIESGHRRIAHIAGLRGQEDTILRRQGYEEALTEAGIEPNPNWVIEGNFRPQSGVLAVEALLSRGETVSAIFAANDQMAYGARLALFRRGIRVPDDISLVGFDDQPDSAYTTPPLTTVRQPAVEIGEAAAGMMLQMLNGKEIELHKLSAQLVIRESTARFR